MSALKELLDWISQPCRIDRQTGDYSRGGLLPIGLLDNAKREFDELKEENKKLKKDKETSDSVISKLLDHIRCLENEIAQFLMGEDE